MSKEELEKLEREKYVVERKLTAAMHKEKRLQSELKTETVNQTENPRAYPGAEISAGRKSLLQGAVRLLPSSEEVGKAIRTATDG